MEILFFTDIDDTLMQTYRKGFPQEAVATGAVDVEGNPSSYMTAPQQGLLEMFQRVGARVVPVTARSSGTLARVKALSFAREAIVDFGATLVQDGGGRHPEWHSLMSKASESLGQRDLFRALDTYVCRQVKGTSAFLKSEFREAGGIAVFFNTRVVVEAHESVRAGIQDWLKEQGVAGDYYLHTTDRDIVVLPSFIRKGNAVQYYLEQNPCSGRLVLAAGDSLNDLSFMSLSDFLLIPRVSEVHKALTGGRK